MIRGFLNYRQTELQRKPIYKQYEYKDVYGVSPENRPRPRRLHRNETETTYTTLTKRPEATSQKIIKSMDWWAMYSHTASRRVCLNRNLKPIFFYRERVMGSFQKLIYLYYSNNMRSFDKKTIRKRRYPKKKKK